MKRRVTLEEAKKALESDKVFLAGNKFNWLDVGKYHSGWTIAIPQEWEIDENDNPIIPDIAQQVECKDLTDGMNVDFDGECKVMFGRYRKSMSGKPVFEVTDPKDAKHVWIRSSWGGAFNHTRGQGSDYASEIGALEFRRSSSNGGGAGIDYYILPVDYINSPEKRDVSQIIENAQSKLDKKREERAEKIDGIKAKRQSALDSKEAVISRLTPMIQAYKEKFGKDIDIVFGEYEMRIGYWDRVYYSEEGLKKAEEYIDNETKRKEVEMEKAKEKEAIKEKIKPFEESLKNIEAKIQYNLESFEVTFVSKDLPQIVRESYRTYETSGFEHVSFEYTKAGYEAFCLRLEQAMDDYKERQSAQRHKEEEIRRKAQRIEDEKKAKEQGYPSNWSFRNRLQGATGLSHAYVISPNGDIREPDDNILKNPNHRHHYTNSRDCIVNADGEQIYNQILPGEIILTFTKEFTRRPYVVDIAWADQMPTEDQQQVLEEKIRELMDTGFAVCAQDEYDPYSDDNQPMTDLGWIERRTKEKVKECRETLKAEKESGFSLREVQDAVNENEINEADQQQ